MTVLIYVATSGHSSHVVAQPRDSHTRDADARARAARDPPSHGACAAMQHKSPKSVDCSGVAIIA